MSRAMEVKERPILFSGPMVRAILRGIKTQTRRVVRPISNDDQGRTFIYRDGVVWASLTKDELAPLDENPPRSVFGAKAIFDGDHAYTQIVVGRGPKGEGNYLRCPYGQIGDQLWVRETWGLRDTQPQDGPERAVIGYRADGNDSAPNGRYQLWRPSIHMPRWASRVTLQITDVRLERLQDLSEEDAIAEGAQCAGFPASLTNRGAFGRLWQQLNGERGFGWDANPWVWVISFTKL